MTPCALVPNPRPRLQREQLEDLTRRELEILSLFAAGYSNAAICDRIHLSEKTVEAHARSIYQKLDLPTCRHSHRRVHAVLIYLRGYAQARLAA